MKLILFSTLAIILICLIIFMVVTVGTVGAAGIIIFADVIVCILIIAYLIKYLVDRKKKN